MNRKKFLLVTSTLPGNFGVGPIILRDLLREIKNCDFSILGLMLPNFSPETNEESFVEQPELKIFTWKVPRNDFWHRFVLIRVIRKIVNFISNILATRQCLVQANHYYSSHQFNGVIVVLDDYKTILTGWRLSRRWRVPLYVYIWDDPDCVLSSSQVNQWLKRYALYNFAVTLKMAGKGAVVSENMQKDYHRVYGLDSLIVRHGISLKYYNLPENRGVTQKTADGEIVIGFAGTLYAISAWEALIEALNHLNWKVDNHDVRIRVLGYSFKFTATFPQRIEFLGYHSPENTIEILRKSTINYLPYPFEPSLYKFSRYSFPTKLSSYVASGAPIMVHAPEYSELFSFSQKNSMGITTSSLDSSILAELVYGFLTSNTAVAKAREVVNQVAKDELSYNKFIDNFRQFLD